MYNFAVSMSLHCIAYCSSLSPGVALHCNSSLTSCHDLIVLQLILSPFVTMYYSSSLSPSVSLYCNSFIPPRLLHIQLRKSRLKHLSFPFQFLLLYSVSSFLTWIYSKRVRGVISILGLLHNHAESANVLSGIHSSMTQIKKCTPTGLRNIT